MPPMNIFFSASTQNLPAFRKTYEHIIDAIKQHHDSVLDSWVVEALQSTATAEPTPKEILMKQNQYVKECDAMIIEASTPSFGVGYLLAQALNERHPILCLYPNDQDIEALSDGIKGSTSSLITLKQYTPANLSDIITDYLDGLNLNPLQKFNFVASKEIVDYIEDAAQKAGKSKSEFLRDLIVRDHMNS